MNYLAKKKKKTIIYLISGILIIASLGTIAYFAWPKKTTETETKTTEEKVSQLQNQLSQIKNALTTLNNNITQTESSLQQKRTQQTQTPQDSLQTQINQLETQLTTYKNQKSKLEIIIPKLEQQIGNLNKGENISEQEKIIDEIEKEIKEVNEELGNNEKKDDEPTKTPPKENDDLPNEEPKPKPEEDDNGPGSSPQPSPNPQPGEKWEDKKSKFLTDAKKEIHDAIYQVSNVWFYVRKEELKIPDYEDKLEKAASETEFNQLKQEILKDIQEIRLGSPGERLKLKEHFIFCLSYEVKFFKWPDETWNARYMEQSLIDDLNQAIKDNKNSTWQRKHACFTGGFKIKNKEDGRKFDNENSMLGNTEKKWVVIKKDHNQQQYHTERNSFFLRKGEPDYQEFKTRKEAIDWLRQNDSYFK